MKAECTPVNCPSPYPGFHTTYSYDLAGDLTSYETIENGITFSYQYDAATRPTTVTSSLVDANHPATLANVNNYWPTSAMHKMSYGNGVAATTAFNNRMQVCRINFNLYGTSLNTCADSIPSGTFVDFTYTYGLGSGDNGNLASWSGNGQQYFGRTYTYDGLSRLSTMSEGASAQPCQGLSWTYDAWGNRTDQTVTAGTCNTFHQTFNANNQLVGPPYQYDAAGNMTHDASHSYTYDAENRLIKVDGGSTATYIYDSQGTRVEKVAAATTQYVHDLGGQVILETDGTGNGSPISDYIYMAGSLVGEYENNTTYFILPDHLGSTRLITNMAEGTTEINDYYPFGELSANSLGQGSTTHNFTGLERDSESNLDHTWFRQYSSSLARWMHPDPAGLAAVDPTNPQSWNRYAYVLNNPLAYVDPLGLDYCDGNSPYTTGGGGTSNLPVNCFLGPSGPSNDPPPPPLPCIAALDTTCPDPQSGPSQPIPCPPIAGQNCLHNGGTGGGSSTTAPLFCSVPGKMPWLAGNQNFKFQAQGRPGGPFPPSSGGGQTTGPINPTEPAPVIEPAPPGGIINTNLPNPFIRTPPNPTLLTRVTAGLTALGQALKGIFTIAPDFIIMMNTNMPNLASGRCIPRG